MTYVVQISTETGPPTWTLEQRGRGSEEVQVAFHRLEQALSNSRPTRQDVLDWFKLILQEKTPRWLTPGFDEWILDLEALRHEFPKLSALRWLRGRVALKPEVTITENTDSIYQRQLLESAVYGGSVTSFWVGVSFRVVPEVVKKAVMLAEAPLGIHHSLAHFRLDFPKPEAVAFIIMRFGKTDAHTLILEGIKKGLAAVGLTGIRADERQYHDDLFNNVLTFMHGCSFGIAVFEQLEESDFNPNVALEVGYMLAMQKPVCILKDRKLQALQTDLMGKLYSEFDSLDPVATISQSLSVWLRNKKLA